MKKWSLFGIVGLILSAVISFITYFVIGNPSDMATPFYLWFSVSMSIYFVPLIIGGAFLDLAKKNKIFLILAIIFFLIPVVATILLLMVGSAFKNIT